jgi:anti-sigma factor RsiW
VRLDKGTLTIAVVAVVVAVLLTTVRGAVVAVLVAVVAGVAATALWQLRLNWLADAARKTKLDRAQEIYALPGSALEGGVAQLLRPEEEVVPFRPRPELDQLIGWVAASEAHVAVQLVTGDGGTGKTRLARQLVHEIAGWRAQWVPAGSERKAVGTARDVGEPVLLVVDYTETRTDLQELLAEVISDTDGPDMRVLCWPVVPGSGGDS